MTSAAQKKIDTHNLAVLAIRRAMSNLSEVDTTGNEVSDKHIMEAEHALRRALSVLTRNALANSK